MLALAPFVEAATRLRLDLLRGGENWRFPRFRVVNDVVLHALRGSLRLDGGPAQVLRPCCPVDFSRIELKVILHEH